MSIGLLDRYEAEMSLQGALQTRAHFIKLPVITVLGFAEPPVESLFGKRPQGQRKSGAWSQALAVLNITEMSYRHC